MLKAARTYINLGFSVIPLEPKGKRPLCRWQEYRQRLALDAELQVWWENTRNNNIGIITGRISRLFVLDIDNKTGWKYVVDRGTGAELAPMVFTGKGVHLYYRYPKEHITVGARIGEERYGIDYRGEGGYVVAPPSMHESGTKYRWENIHSTSQLKYLPYPPQWIIDIIKAKRNGNGDGNFNSIVGGVGKGSRNNTAARMAGLLLHRFKESEWDIAWELLKAWNKNNTPPLKEQELKNVFKSIYYAEKGRRNG